MTTDYRVQLDAFEGPLDLLLYLIRRAEVDVTDIPIATIADQYMEYLGQIEEGVPGEGRGRIDIERAGEFLVMAATLMEIKSRMLSPAPPTGDSGEAPGLDKAGEGRPDPRAELVRQLLAYKRFRDAAEALEHRKREWEQRFPAARAGLDDDRLREALQDAGELDLEDLGLIDLVEAFGRIMSSVNFDRLGDHTVVYDDTPIELHAEDLLDRLRSEAGVGPLSLAAIFAGRTRSEMIGLFLAVLELVRRRRVVARQEPSGGPITLSLNDDAEPPRGE